MASDDDRRQYLRQEYKDAFGVSASQWRGVNHREQSKIRKTNRKVDQAIGKFSKDIDVSVFYSET